VHDTGTVVVVNGPRFSTRAESAWFRDAGWHVINMTQYPEAALAAEAGIPFAGLALVTDYDSGVEDDPDVAPVTQEEVFAFFDRNVDRLRELLVDAAPRLASAAGSSD
jgi:5'-methylthioadenosine phosphorylase